MNIREGISDIIGDCLTEMGCVASGCPKAEIKALEAQEVCLNSIIQFLKDNGVVRKVDRKLPELFYWNTKIQKSAESYVAELVEAGYVAVEDL